MKPYYEPRFKVGERVRILHEWAAGAVRTIEDVQWDVPWNCYTYGLDCSLIRIEEDMLELAHADPPSTTGAA